ncbi:MAG: hypothetical protein ACI97A_001277 [Planctomycetota bacterium]|jgi:hypothetical protein
MQKSRLLSITAVAFVLMSVSALSQPYEYTWGQRLMQDYRYEDMAEVVFTRLSKVSSKRDSVLGVKGLAQLKRRQALLSEDLAERAKFNDECLEMFRKVTKSMKRGSIEYFETFFDLAATIQDIVSEEIRFIQEGRIPSGDQMEAVTKRNENRLAEATQIYERAAATLEAMVNDPKALDLSRRASLDKNVVRLLRAELIGTDPKKLKSPFRNEALVDAVEELEDFGLFNSGTLWEMYSYIWLGRVHAALYEGGFGETDIAKVDFDYWYVFQSLTGDEAMTNPNWATIVSQSLYWEFQFLNKHGATDLVVEHGDKMIARYAELGWTFDYNGRMAQIELGRAYQTVGRTDAALTIAASVSAKGGFPGQEADKLMSLVIRTDKNKDQLDAVVLASGANGAWVAARNNPEKYAEAIQLYQIVLFNLAKVKDVEQRNILGREAYYRIGRCNDKLGRSIEAYIALEQAYKRFNNEHLGENRKINQDIAKYWRAVGSDLVRITSGAPFANELRNKCNDWVIAHQPAGIAGGGGDVMRLLWAKAQGQFRSKSYADSLLSYEKIAAKPSEYQERAMVKVAVVTSTLLLKNKDATAPQWRAAAKKFEDYLAYTEASKATDPLQLKSRRAALVEANFQLTECFIKAAGIEPDLAVKKQDYAKIPKPAMFVIDNSKDANVKQHCRYNMLVALLDSGKTEEANASFKDMYAADPNHKLIWRAALKVSNSLSKKFEAMPRGTVEDAALANPIRLESIRAYRVYLIANLKSKSSYWSRGIKGFYELERWAEAEELIDQLLKRFGSKLPQKTARYANRCKARCLLERAKIAFAGGDKEKTDRLFEQAAPIYAKLVGKDNKASNVTLEEAAQIFGGFLSEENRRGQRNYYQGNAEYERAAKIWKKLQSRFRRSADSAENDVEEAVFQAKAQRARIYTFLLVYKDAKQKGDARGLKKIKRNVDAVFQKTSLPGGKKLVGLWEWLRDQDF